MRQIATVTSDRPKLLDDITLEPPYWPQLLELIARLVERPMDARRVPMELDAILYDFDPFDPAQTITVSRKLAWDVGLFLLRAAALPPSFGAVFGVNTETSRRGLPATGANADRPALAPLLPPNS